MKKITLSLLMASSLLFGAFEADWEVTDGDVYVGNQVIVNEIIGGNNKVDFIDSQKEVGVSGQIINVGDIKILNIPVGYNLDANFGLELNFPIVSNKDYITGGSKTGLGDISLGGNYHFGDLLDEKGSNITTVTYKSTTGDDNSGLGATVSSLTFSHRMSKNYDEMIKLDGLVSYTLNNTGDSTLLMFGGSRPCMLSDKLTTNIKLTYFHIDSLVDQEVDTVDIWLGWTSKKLVQSIPLGFGFKLPIINNKGGDSKDRTILFYLSGSSFFDN